MAGKPKRAVVDKWKKKKTFKILGSKEVGNVELGETIADKPELLVGRNISVNMGLALNQARKKNIDLTFKIKDVQGSNATTELVGYETKKSYLRRLFRRRTSKIESVQYLTSKDKRRFKIVSVIVTFRKIEREKQKDIRKLLETFIAKTAKANNFDAIMGLILQKDILYEIMPEVKKIAAIKRTEIETIKCLA